MAWILNRDGFYSIVKKDCGSDELLVRSRILDDLKRLADKLNIPASQILTTLLADYRYRLTVPAKAFSEYLATEALQIDYDNFKALLPHATPDDKKRARVYADVWSALYQLQ